MGRHQNVSTPDWQELMAHADEQPPATLLPVEEQDMEGLAHAWQIVETSAAPPAARERWWYWLSMSAANGYRRDTLEMLARGWVTGEWPTGGR